MPRKKHEDLSPVGDTPTDQTEVYLIAKLKTERLRMKERAVKRQEQYERDTEADRKRLEEIERDIATAGATADKQPELPLFPVA